MAKKQYWIMPVWSVRYSDRKGCLDSHTSCLRYLLPGSFMFADRPGPYRACGWYSRQHWPVREILGADASFAAEAGRLLERFRTVLLAAALHRSVLVPAREVDNKFRRSPPDKLSR